MEKVKLKMQSEQIPSTLSPVENKEKELSSISEESKKVTNEKNHFSHLRRFLVVTFNMNEGDFSFDMKMGDVDNWVIALGIVLFFILVLAIIIPLFWS